MRYPTILGQTTCWNFVVLNSGAKRNNTQATLVEVRGVLLKFISAVDKGFEGGWYSSVNVDNELGRMQNKVIWQFPPGHNSFPELITTVYLQRSPSRN